MIEKGAKVLARYLAITDLETTGLDEENAVIIQIAREVIDRQLAMRVDALTWSCYVLPSDAGWVQKTKQAMAVNQIKLSTLTAEGWTLETALQGFSLGVNWKDTPLTAWGNDFELKFLDAAFKSIDRVKPYNFKSFDVRSYANGRQVEKGLDYEYRGLHEAAKDLGIEVDTDKLHDAVYDTWLTSEIYLTLLREGRESYGYGRNSI